MEIFQFRRWCENAVSGIIFPGDKREVYRELMAHMEDHYDALLEQGIDEKTAREMVEKAMGDPWPVAKQLAQIHKPFWGYFLRTTRVLLVIVFLIALIPLIRFARDTDFRVPSVQRWDMYDTASYGGDTERTLLHLSEPEVSFESDGYTFTVTDAVCWHSEESDIQFFCCLIDQFNPLPWAVHSEVGYWFWAEDSLGNHYYSYYESAQDEDPRKPAMYGNQSQTGLLTCTYEFWINDFPDAEWLKIHYDRDGRNEVLFIDLTGGGAA